LNFVATLADIQAYANNVSVPWLGECLSEYLQALVFRKFLALPPGLVERLLALSLFPGFIEIYTYASALARGAAAPERSDFLVGVERCEKELASHGYGAQVFTGTYLRVLRDQWKTFRDLPA
jgi:hypothetical protein